MRNVLLSLTACVALATCRPATRTSGEAASPAAASPASAPTALHPAWSRHATIYEVNVRQYTPEGTFAALQQHLPRLKRLGVDILWLMPVQPIGKKNRKGTLGSYYSISDYTAINPEFGTEADFKAFVDAAHQQGMKVILDWVANHTAFDHEWASQHRNYYDLRPDGSMRNARDNEGRETDWTDVAELNYGNAEMRRAMIGEMRWWLGTMDLDGFRCDVAGGVPTDFWLDARRALLASEPQLFMLAEAESPAMHAAFDMTYGWDLHHLLNELAQGKASTAVLDEYFAGQRRPYPPDAYRMYFTSNHDENSWQGTEFERMGANHLPAFVLSATAERSMPLIYTGQEVSLKKRLRFFDKDTVDWNGPSLEGFYRAMLELKHSQPALANGAWGGAQTALKTNGGDRVYAFTRTRDTNTVLVAVNFGDATARVSYEGLARPGAYTDWFDKAAVPLAGAGNLDIPAHGYRVLVRIATGGGEQGSGIAQSRYAGAAGGAARPTVPVLAFPEPGLDDSAAYQGYQTRFFRDAAGNTVQVYLDARSGRVVHLWADAENESIGFTARDAQGRPAALRWDGPGAEVSGDSRTRTLEYRLATNATQVAVGWLLLGSMRVERDFQYAERHRAPFGGAPFALPEVDRLLAALDRLGAAERPRHLALLGAPDTRALRARLRPTVTTTRTDTSWVARAVQPSLDGRDTIALELRADPRRVAAARGGDTVSLRARSAGGVAFTVRVSTTGKALTPLTREQIFTPAFLDFLAAAKRERAAGDTGAGAPALRARRLERQVRGVELLASREKLMAGLPTYATYFGRDMLVTALMMRPIWRDEMSENVIASVLRKLSPRGEVSHEEALGGQAVRESAAEYATLVEEHLGAMRRGDRSGADSLLARAYAVLRDLRHVRENYHMIDDEFQLAVLAGRWLGDPGVPAARKRAFLLDSSDGGGSRLEHLLRELALVSRMTAAYVSDQVASNLVSFPPRDSGQWSAASWRDSRVGYAGGRYAMDVNAIWVPHALASAGRILETLRALGISVDSVAAAKPDLMTGAPLGTYARDSLALRRAVDAWRGASRHFLVRLGPAAVRSHVAERLAALPREEREYWTRVLATSRADRDSLAFLALSLDAKGRPIGVANTDPATRLFLGGRVGATGRVDTLGREGVLRDVRLFVRPYPVGLLIAGVGPVVANDAYAPPRVWRDFERDRYHGPRVVWGREVNLFLLGAAGRISDAGGGAEGGSQAGGAAAIAYVRELREAIERVHSAVQASGFHSELWSYEVENGRVVPVRYGTSADVQLWSTTDLAVQFALSRLGR